MQLVRYDLLFDMDSNMKRRASESFPTVIGTLDAIHLSTARAIGLHAV